MVCVIVLQELCELFRCEGWVIVSIEQTRQFVLRDELLQVHTQRLGGFCGDFI